MYPRRLGLLFMIVLGLTGCQTTGGDPSATAVAALERNGFKSGNVSEFNKNLNKDDILTVASYECEKPRCSKDTLVIFGVDPDSTNFASEFDSFRQGNPAARARLLRTAIGKEFGTYFTGLDASTFMTQDGGKGLRITGRVKQSKVPRIIRGQEFHMAITYLQRNNIGRVIIAISDDGATARRYTSLDLLN